VKLLAEFVVRDLDRRRSLRWRTPVASDSHVGRVGGEKVARGKLSDVTKEGPVSGHVHAEEMLGDPLIVEN
jgi:hypothetical protein